MLWHPRPWPVLFPRHRQQGRPPQPRMDALPNFLGGHGIGLQKPRSQPEALTSYNRWVNYHRLISERSGSRHAPHPSRGDCQRKTKMAQKGFRASFLAAGKGGSNNWDLKPREYRLPQRGYWNRTKREKPLALVWNLGANPALSQRATRARQPHARPRVPCAAGSLPAGCARAASAGTCSWVVPPPTSALSPRPLGFEVPARPGLVQRDGTRPALALRREARPRPLAACWRHWSPGNHVYGVLLRDRRAGLHHRGRRRHRHRRRFLLRHRVV